MLLHETLREKAEAVTPAPDAVRSVTVRAHRIRRRRRGSAMAAGATAVMAAVLAGALVALPEPRHGGPAVDVPGKVSRFDAPKVKARYLQPVPLNGSLYMVNDNGDVVRVDASGNALTKMRPALGLPGQPLPIVFGASIQALFASGGGLWLVGTVVGVPYYLQRLDPVSLKVVRRIKLSPRKYSNVVATETSIWTGQLDDVVRLDGRTGAITEHLRVVGDLPPDADRNSFELVSVDEKAGVAWLSGQAANQIPVVLSARITSGRLTVTGFNTAVERGDGGLAPGGAGTLWAASRGTIVHLEPAAKGIVLRRRAAGTYLPRAWHKQVEAFTATRNRLWALEIRPGGGPRRTTLVCLDNGNGEVLGRYPIPESAAPAPSLELTGDEHRVYTQVGSHLYTVRGPDRCLS
ncbi:hypothetical protein AB0L06_20075 [Spirillospora sp. NPDC052269]